MRKMLFDNESKPIQSNVKMYDPWDNLDKGLFKKKKKI